MEELLLGHASTGGLPLFLRVPVIVHHTIDKVSPLAQWTEGPSGRAPDVASEIVVVVEATRYGNGKHALRTRTYRCLEDVKWNVQFAPVVSRPMVVPLDFTQFKVINNKSHCLH